MVEHLLSTPEPHNSIPSTGTKKLGRTGSTWKCSQWSLNDGPSFFLLLSENIHFFKESTQLPTAPLLALGVCAHNCLQGYFKHESQTLGWPKEGCSRWSFYQFPPNTSHLSRSGFYCHLPGFSSEWQFEPWCHSLEWRNSALHGEPTTQLEHRKTGRNDPFKLSFICDAKRSQWSVGCEVQSTVPR